jgi:hypothetical protein
MTPAELDAALEKACEGKRLGFQHSIPGCNCPLGHLVQIDFPPPAAIVLPGFGPVGAAAFMAAYDTGRCCGIPFTKLGLKWRARALAQESTR